jgi:hypothetical protein
MCGKYMWKNPRRKGLFKAFLRKNPVKTHINPQVINKMLKTCGKVGIK